MGLKNRKARESEGRKYYRFGMDCQNCHTRHAFSKAEASEPEACMTCHMGFDHAQWGDVFRFKTWCYLFNEPDDRS